MKRIHTIITDFAAILGLKTHKKTPQLIAVTQENFCQNMTITDLLRRKQLIHIIINSKKNKIMTNFNVPTKKKFLKTIKLFLIN
jgi:hypothetical protein